MVPEVFSYVYNCKIFMSSDHTWNISSPTHCKVSAFHTLKTSTNKIELQRNLGISNFLLEVFYIYMITCILLKHFLYSDVWICSNKDWENLSKGMNAAKTENDTPSKAETTFSFITDASLFFNGSLVFQKKKRSKIEVFYDSRFYATNYQINCSIH